MLIGVLFADDGRPFLETGATADEVSEKIASVTSSALAMSDWWIVDADDYDGALWVASWHRSGGSGLGSYPYGEVVRCGRFRDGNVAVSCDPDDFIESHRMKRALLRLTRTTAE